MFLAPAVKPVSVSGPVSPGTPSMVAVMAGWEVAVVVGRSMRRRYGRRGRADIVVAANACRFSA